MEEKKTNKASRSERAESDRLSKCPSSSRSKKSNRSDLFKKNKLPVTNLREPLRMLAKGADGQNKICYLSVDLNCQNKNLQGYVYKADSAKKVVRQFIKLDYESQQIIIKTKPESK